MVNISWIIAIFIVFCCQANAATISMVDNGKVVKNPDMGWTIYYYANSLKYYANEIDKVTDAQLFSFPGLSTAMFRLSWSHIEPAEGNYRWDLIDNPANRFISNGIKIAIRISNSENAADQPYATPKWVFDAGAASVRFQPGYPGILDVANGANREPVFNDPIFLEKLEKFIKNFANRYDGDPNVAYIDIGSFGVYGEGHTYSSTKTGYDASVVKTHIDLYRKYFKKTKLIANHNFADHAQDGTRNIKIIEYAASLGLGFRDDSILIDKEDRAFYDQEMAALFYRQSPVILETGEYSTRVKKGYWNPIKILEAVKAYRASYIGAYWDPVGYMSKNMEIINEVNKIIGYRYAFSSVSYPDSMVRGDAIKISYVLRNSGVSKCYKNGWVEFSLYKKNGDLVAKSVNDSVNVCDIYKDSFNNKLLEDYFSMEISSDVPEGSYIIYASVVDEQGYPWLELPHDGKMAGENRYKVGTIIIRSKARGSK